MCVVEIYLIYFSLFDSITLYAGYSIADNFTNDDI